MALLLSEEDAGWLSEIIQHFFQSAVDVLKSLRLPLHPISTNGTTDQSDWFNIGVASFEDAQLKPWLSRDVTRIPPLVVETVLDLTRLSPGESIVTDGKVININKKSEIVLERWLLHLNLDDYGSVEDDAEMAVADIYNKLVVSFRCLYTLVTLLPAYRLKQVENTSHLEIKIKILDGSKPIPSKGRIGLSKPLSAGLEEDIKSKDLSPVLTPIGSLNVSVSYRQNCDFQVQSNEQVLSNHFQNAADDSNLETTTSYTKFSPTQNELSNPLNASNEQQSAHRVSISSMDSARMRRKSSIRASSIFKTGSIASSSPPPAATSLGPNNDLLAGTPPLAQLKSLHLSSKPIPMRDVSVSSFASKKELSASGDSGFGSYQPEAKISSSFGSKYKAGSRNNSIDDRMLLHKPVLEGLKAKYRMMSSLSVDSESEDLNGFMKLLDSKPDLRFSGSSLISNNCSSSDVFEESLKNYRSLRDTDLFKDPNFQTATTDRNTSPQPPPTATTDKNLSDSAMRLLRGGSPLSSSPKAETIGPYHSIPMNARVSRESRTSISHISPSSQASSSFKAPPMNATSSVGATGSMNAKNSNESAYMLKRFSLSSSPGTGSDSLIERLRRGSNSSNNAPVIGPEHHLSNDLANNGVSSQLRFVLSHALSGSSPSSDGIAKSRRGSDNSNRYLVGELKKLSYTRGVFDSDEEVENDEEDDEDTNANNNNIGANNGEPNYHRKQNQLIPLSLLSDPISGVTGVQVRPPHRNSNDDDDDLVFEMSDMKHV